jgi:hypothetical protein
MMMMMREGGREGGRVGREGEWGGREGGREGGRDPLIHMPSKSIERVFERLFHYTNRLY